MKNYLVIWLFGIIATVGIVTANPVLTSTAISGIANALSVTSAEGASAEGQ